MADYDFSTLSPKDFELLVRDLLHAEHGWQLEAFGAGPDGGVDLRGGVNGTKLVVQCKHYTGSTFSQLHAAVRDEKVKMAAEKPDRYVLATSRDLSRTQKDQLAKTLGSLLIDSSDILGKSDVNHLLALHPKVEGNHFKLWLASAQVLERIVQSGIWARSEALLEDIQSRVQLYVSNPSYHRVADTLASDRVVIISGSPGVGKSLLAEMLLLAHWNEGWQIIQVGSNIDEAWDLWKPEERQVFYYDDFLGQTSYGEVLAKNEDSRIARFADRVRQNDGKRLIFTTRTQILKQAELTYERLRPERLWISDCVVTIDDYSRSHKARILYNHLFFSQLPRSVIKDFASDPGNYMPIVDHPNFSPRIIEQVAKRPHMDSGELRYALVSALDRPIELWGPSFETGLSDSGRQILLQMLSFPAHGLSLTEFTRSITGTSFLSLQLTQTIRTLEGSWLQFGESYWLGRTIKLANPSCRDYLLSFLELYPDGVGEILASAKQLSQVAMILRYGLSRVKTEDEIEQFEFPTIRAYLDSNNEVTFETITRLWPTADGTLGSSELEAVGTLLLGRDLMPATFKPWIWQSVADSIEAAEHSFDPAFSVTGEMAEVARELDADNSEAVLTACLVHCGNSIASTDDYTVFLAMLHELVSDFGIDEEDVLVKTDDALADTLIREISEIPSNLSDTSEMESVLEDYVQLALEYGMGNRVENAVQEVRNHIDEREGCVPDEEYLIRPPSRSAFEEPSDLDIEFSSASAILGPPSSSRHDDGITELFRQLR